MGISTFSPPMKATHVSDQLPRFVIAVTTDDRFLVVDGDGRLEWLASDQLTIDWRYDPASGLWGDPQTGEIEDPLGEEYG